MKQTAQLATLLEGQQKVIETIAIGGCLKGVLSSICEQIESIIDSPHAKSSILLLEGDQLRHGAAPNLPEAYCALIDGLLIGPGIGSCGTAAFTGKQVIVSDIRTDPLWANFRELAESHELRSCWSTPILSSEQEVLGTFAIYYSRAESPDKFHLDLIEYFTHLSGIAIEKERSELAKRLAQEKELSALAAKSEFLGNISHELRTPMNGILGMLELLTGSPLNEEQQEVIDTISSCGEDLMSTINNLLDMSQVGSGKFDLEPSRFDLHESVKEVVERHTQLLHAQEMSIEIHIDEHLPRSMCGDIARIKQILGNHLSNAIKFADGGGQVRIDIDGAQTANGQHSVSFRVTDNGIGISEEDQTKLFRAFGQADTSLTRSFGGAGLGLAISSNLTRLMGGSIDLQSELGVGTAIRFTLPLAPSAQDPEGANNPSQGAAPVWFLGHRRGAGR